ncbi:MAG: hypothetical protein IJ054_04005, partial [Lachnospiraceae bacterium]|nr:hypothetical protein [Lachnospiraceae bacterium]
MKKFKKAMALSLALAMGLSLAACGDDKKDDGDATEATTTEAAKDDAGDEDTEAPADTEDGEVAEGGIAAPSTDGWDDSKKIYAYAWDDDFGKHIDVVLNAYPEYKDYVEVVNLGVPSEESLEQFDLAFDSDKYPSLIPGDVGSAKYWTEDDSKTANLLDLGFTEDMWADNYDYAKEYASYNGEL